MVSHRRFSSHTSDTRPWGFLDPLQLPLASWNVGPLPLVLELQRLSTEVQKRASDALPVPAFPPHTHTHTRKSQALSVIAKLPHFVTVSPLDCDTGVKRPIGAEGQETVQPGTVTTVGQL